MPLARESPTGSPVSSSPRTAFRFPDAATHAVAALGQLPVTLLQLGEQFRPALAMVDMQLTRDLLERKICAG